MTMPVAVSTLTVVSAQGPLNNLAHLRFVVDDGDAPAAVGGLGVLP